MEQLVIGSDETLELTFLDENGDALDLAAVDNVVLTFSVAKTGRRIAVAKLDASGDDLEIHPDDDVSNLGRVHWPRTLTSGLAPARVDVQMTVEVTDAAFPDGKKTHSLLAEAFSLVRSQNADV